MSKVPPAEHTSTAAFERLLGPVLDQAYGTALRLTGDPSDAEDLLQDASLLALRGFDAFRRGSNFKAWFFRILVNRFYSLYRRSRRHGVALDVDQTPDRHLLDRAEAAGLQQVRDPAAAVFGQLDVEAITAALDALPDDFREVATLYFMQDFSYQEIAEVMEIPVGTVRSRLHRARRTLQTALWALAVERGIVASAGDDA